MKEYWAPLLVIAAGLVASVAALTAWATCDCAKLPLDGEIARVAAGMSFVGAGALAMLQRGTGRVGSLMSAAGLAWFVDDLGWIYHPLPYTLARLGSGLFQPMLAHLCLAFPGGRLRTRLDRVLAGACYALFLLASVATLTFWDPADAGCPGCPRNLLMLDRDPVLHDVVEQISTATALAMTFLVVVRVVQHWSSASFLGRRALSPVVWAVGPLSLAVAVYLVIGRSFVPPLAPLALTSLPAGFLIGLLRVHLSRADVGRLVVELGEAPLPGQLRDALARTLHDPSLEVVYWARERKSFVDATGNPAVLPAPSSSRIATLLRREGEPIAALVHDLLVEDDPTLIQAAAAAASLAIDNERLHAEVQAQLQEMRASRARIVQASDIERRRIERDLHDGSQQRLVALSIVLTMAQARTDAHADPELGELLREASDELSSALRELRELARGIHPAVLTEAGLGPALRSLAKRSALPVKVTATPDERLPPPIEAAAYFVVAESLANVAKHAHAAGVVVAACRVDGQLLVEVSDDGVGGAETSRGSGLQGLSDRVGALDGRLEVVSPPEGGTLVRAVIPCSST